MVFLFVKTSQNISISADTEKALIIIVRLLSRHVIVIYVIAVERDVSEESAVWGAGAGGGLARFRAPHKLQIVKPLEGSLTLHTWAQLAKPTMSGNYSAHLIL